MGPAKNHARSSAREPASDQESPAPSADQAAKDARKNVRGVNAEKMRLRLTAFVTEHLTREERLVITLRFCEELTLGEIAATLDLPESRVRQILNDVSSEIRKRFVDKADKDVVLVG